VTVLRGFSKAAARVSKGRQPKRAGVTIVGIDDKEFSKLYDQLGKDLYKANRAAVKAAAEVVKTEAAVSIASVAEKTPGQRHIGDSAKTRTRYKWSNSVRATRAANLQGGPGSAKVRVKVLKKIRRSNIAVALVGMDYYGNNFGHTHEPLPGKKPALIDLWGSGVKYQLPKRPWLLPAAQMTMKTQMAVIKLTIKSFIG